MSQDPKLAAKPRTKLGTAEARRLRRDNYVPGNVFGHGEAAVTVAVPEDALTPIVMSGHKVVDLELNGATEKAILREVQWDTFSIRLIHFDLQRVSADEQVETEVAIETHGTAPGVLAGGVLEVVMHTIAVRCPATSIPDRIEVNINHLELGKEIRVKDLPLPESVKPLADADDVVMHVVHPTIVEDEEVNERGPMEPEVVGKADKDEDEG